MKILITGSAGLIGTALKCLLTKEAIDFVGIDPRSNEENFVGSILDTQNLAEKMAGCTGIIHLAAVSRVALSQKSPALCWETNVEGTRNVLFEALKSSLKPWVIYASSREVYGQQNTFPVKESVGLAPLNTYGYSKVCAEMEVLHARSLGLKTSIVRFSNVYGGDRDHVDRVIPAFVSGALSNSPLRLEGAKNIFDFTHVKDVARGLLSLIRLVNLGKSTIRPLHFVSGRGTTLEELSGLVLQYCGSSSKIDVAPSRTFDVHSFVGDPYHTKKILDWSAQISLEEGISRMVHNLQQAA